MSRYQLKVTGDLFFSRAALKQERLVRVATLLIDTGSSYTSFHGKLSNRLESIRQSARFVVRS